MFKKLKPILFIFVFARIQNFIDFEPTIEENNILQNIQNKYQGKISAKQQRFNHEPVELHHRFNKAIKERNAFIKYLIDNEATFASLHTQIATNNLIDIIKNECVNSDMIVSKINDQKRINPDSVSKFYDESIFQKLCEVFYNANKANCELKKAIEVTIISAAENFNLDLTKDPKILLQELINSEKNPDTKDKIKANSIFQITANNNVRYSYFNLWINTGYLLKTMKETQLSELLYSTNQNANLNGNKNMRHLSNLYQTFCYKEVKELLDFANEAEIFYMIQTYENGELDFDNWIQDWYSYIPQYVQKNPNDRYSFNIIISSFTNIVTSPFDFYVQRKSDYGIIAGFAQDLFIEGVPTELSKETLTLNCFSFSNYKRVEMCNFINKNKIII